MYKETGVKKFNDASNFWIQEGIKRAIQEDGYAGYKQYTGKYSKWQNETNVLEGIAGIGLIIIDQLANFETNWDKSLMSS